MGSDQPDEMTGKVIEFALTTPGTDAEIAGQVAHACSLKLPGAYDHKPLSIVANGPSARAYFTRLAQWHHAPEAVPTGDTLALNGALELFTDQGGYPTYWMGCDAQAAVAAFVRDPPEKTIYLVASHCHPDVFDALWDREVRLWHRSDAESFLPPGTPTIPVAISVTMSALQWALRAGYREVDVWGWDCCFGPDGAHHAGSGAILEEPPLEVEVGPKRVPFQTRRAWAVEAQDAVYVLPILRWAGMNVRIHGGGLVAAVIEEFAAEPLQVKAA